ncbi:recombinase family protein [Bacillus sp. JJ722]|uniref:recombinase family protein n=1 Tax=Bacillus sp. JJ722 TaxID=3122973 RepID=UPI003000F304
MIRAALYIRVSTQDQVENYSIESQQERLEAYCKAKNWLIYDTYIDGGFSGSTTDRPDLQRMLRDMKEFDAVVVYKLDRLSRSQKDTLELIEDHFLKNNVDFVSITETLDTTTPFGKAMIGILSVFAQLERETIAERMKMGLIKRAENGLRSMGGDYDPTGYARVEGKLIVKEDEAKHIQRTYDLYEQYHSITKVQKALKNEGFNVWRFRRYRDILRNPLYVGKITFSGQLYDGQHTPIISSKQFEEVQKLIDRHKGHNSQKAKKSLLTGLIRCKCCGEQYLSYSTGTGPSSKEKHKYYYYICKARRFPYEFDEKCMNKIWNRGNLEEIIINELKSISIEKSKKKKKEQNKIDYNKLLNSINSKIERVIELYAEESISKEALDKKINKYNEEKQHLLTEMNKQKESDFHITDEMLRDMIIPFDTLEFKEKQVLMNSLIKEIQVDNDNIIINWCF